MLHPTATSFLDILSHWAAERPEQEAFGFLPQGERVEASLSYAELDRRARALGARLAEAGYGGQRLLLVYPAGLAFVEAFFGCLYAGAVAVPVYPPGARGLQRLEAIVHDARPAALLTTSGAVATLGRSETLAGLCTVITDALAPASGRALAPVAPDALAFLQYTSGSTSSPKGVMVSHANLLANARAIQAATRVAADAVFLSWLPLYHDMGLMGMVLQPLFLGCRALLMPPTAFMQRPMRWLEAIDRHGVTTSGAPNFAYALCAERATPEALAALDLSRWTLAFNGAEPVRAETLDTFAEAFAPAGFRREALYPCYGLAEATLFVSGGAPSAAPVRRDVDAVALAAHDVRTPGPGVASTPLVGSGGLGADTDVRIVEPGTGRLCGSGRVGEIWVAGPQVARGYWGRPEESIEAFEARLDGLDARFLRTGDLGFLADGELFVTGRLKDMIVVRGRNLYPQDLERTAEAAHPALVAGGAAAFALAGVLGESVGLALEVRRGQQDVGAILDAVRRAVAEAHGVTLGEVALLRQGGLPRTSSGKVRRSECRRRLLDGELAPLALEARVASRPAEDAGGTETELTVAALMARVLGLPRVGRDDHFFELGGDSLSAAAVVGGVREALGVDLPLDGFYAAPTPSAVAALVAAAPTAAPLPALAGPAPSSAAQRRMLAVELAEPGSRVHHVSAAARLRGPLEPTALASALLALAQRHEALRTRFERTEDDWLQVVVPASVPELVAEPLIESALDAALSALARAPFAPEAGPLWRCRLFRLGPQDHVLALVAHHAVVDGSSFGILAAELSELYRSALDGDAPSLAPPTGDYGAHCAAERAGDFEASLAFWRGHLADAPALLTLPTAAGRPVQPSPACDRVPLALPAPLADRLKALARREGATLYEVLLAGFYAVLGAYGGSDDLVVGVPAATRGRAETAGVVGLLTNTLAVRGDLTGRPSGLALIGRVQAALRGAFAHQAVPFERVLQAIAPQRSPGRPPLVQVMLNLLPPATLRLPGLEAAMLPPFTDQAPLELTLTWQYTPEGLVGHLEFRTDLYDRGLAEQLAAKLSQVLERLAASPEVPLAELLGPDPVERELLATWNATEQPQPETSIHALFEQQILRTPEAIALVEGEREISYAELDGRASALASRLVATGLRPEEPVGLHVTRSVEMVVGMLGILKAGGAYVPLDPGYPAERLGWMLDDVDPRLVVGSGPLPGRERTTVSVDGPAEAVALPDVSDEQLAYVLYTSGSSGRPKGVMVTHGGVANMIMAQVAAFGIVPGRRLLQLASIGFDASVSEIFLALASGATLVLAPPAATAGEALQAVLRESTVDVATVPPSVLQSLDSTALPALRTLIVAGEACPLELAERWAIDRQVFNAYGPTEASVCATLGEFVAGSGRVPIGRPIANTRAHVLDDALNPVPVGVAGELCLGGAGLARGYWNRPDLTEEKFVRLPDSQERLYRTGDRARWLADGTLEYLGRLDRQVKLRGQRVEPGEVEAVLASHPGVKASAVEPRWLGATLHMVAYVVPVAEAEPAAWRAHLEARLPAAWVPASFVVLSELPLTPNGKLDRQALVAPAVSEKLAPRTPQEAQMAALWASVLGLEDVGVHDDFFELGGDSILVLQVAARAHQFGLSISPQQIFKHRTVAELALAGPAEAPACSAEPAGPVPLTPIQRWFFAHAFEAPAHWNQAIALSAHEPLDPDRLRRAFAAVVAHHEALRLRFEQRDGEWRQTIAREGTFGFREVWLDAPDEQAVERLWTALHAGLDLANGPLVAIALQHTPGEPDWVLWVIHHLAVDASSWPVLVQDLATAYGQLGGESPVDLPIGVPFSRWASHLDAVPTPPTGAPAGAEVGARRRQFSLDPAATEALLRGRSGRDVEALLVAALGASLGVARIDVERHGREAPSSWDLSRTVGWLTSLRPLALDGPRESLTDALVSAWTARPDGRLPADALLNYMGRLDAGAAGNGLFDAVPAPFAGARAPENHRTHPLVVDAYLTLGRLCVVWADAPDAPEDAPERFLTALTALAAEAEPQGAHGLSPAQEGMLFHAIAEPGAYVVQLEARLRGPLDVPALRAAWEWLLARHDIFRTSFRWGASRRPIQVVSRRAALPFEHLDGRGWSPGALPARCQFERERAFALDEAPLMRVLLVELGDGCHHLVWTHHHLLSDGWSLPRVLSALFAAYDALRRGQAPALPSGRPFRDYMAWLERQDEAAAMRFWRERLAGVEAPTPLPGDGTGFGSAHGAIEAEWPPAQTAALAALARTQGLTQATVLAAAWALVLARGAGERDVVFGMAVAARPAELEGAEGIIGPLLNTQPVRAVLAPAQGASAWAQGLQQQLGEQRRFDYARLSDIQSVTDVPRGVPLFESLLVVENYPLADAMAAGAEACGLVVEDTRFHDQPHYALSLIATPGDALSLRLVYDGSRFSAEAAGQLTASLSQVLERLAASPEAPLAELLGPDPGERELLATWNATEQPQPETSIHALFEQQALRTPEAIALVEGGREVSFAELDGRANALASRLVAAGLRPEEPVGLHVTRSVEMVVGMLGILKAGGAYVPLDPGYPAERLGWMLDDVDPRLVVGSGPLPGRERTTVSVDGPAEAVALPDVSGEQLAYVLYTSGSSGRPKGVLATHRGAVNRFAWMWRAFPFAPGEVACLKTTPSFVDAVWEVFGPLLQGVPSVITPDDVVTDPARFVAALADGGVTRLVLVPSLLATLLEASPDLAQRLPRLALWVVSGEALTPELARRFHDALPGRTLLNLYGSSEVAADATYHVVAPGAGRVPIGRPIANTRAHVLDDALSPVPIGVAGELCLGGAGLARGYWNRPDLTEEKFVRLPDSQERLYRTGDRARWLADGTLEYLGRLDRQVKLRGQRVEPGEVEAVLASHPGVKASAVEPRWLGATLHMVAYVVPVAEAEPAAWRAHLEARLPAAWVPASFVVLSELPLTPNGKLDRQALVAPAVGEKLAPRTPQEAQLAALWASVLGLEDVGVHDDFFELGGDSLSAMRLVARVQAELGAELPLSRLLAGRTVASIAGSLDDAAPLPTLTPDPEGRYEPFPLNEIQQAYWIGRGQSLALGNVSTHAYMELEVRDLELARLEGALDQLIGRHDMLRAVFSSDGTQRVLSTVPPYRIAERDMRGDAQAEASLAEVRARMSHHVLPADRWPLFEVAASRLPGGVTRLHLSVDALITDAWSLRALAGELIARYERPDSPASPPVPLGFRDYVLAEHALVDTPAYRRDMAYWQARLPALPPAPELPLLADPAAIASPVFARHERRLAPGPWARLKGRAAARALTPAAVLLTAFSEALAAWSKHAHFTLMLTRFHRLALHPRVDELVGDFTALTPLAIALDDDAGFDRQAERVQARMWSDLAHGLVGGVTLLRELARAEGRPRAAFPVVFTSTLSEGAASDEGAIARLGELVYGVSQTPQVYLDHQVSEQGGALVLRWDAIEALFPAGMLEALADAVVERLNALADDEAAWLTGPSGLTRRDREAVSRYNVTGAPLPLGLLHEGFYASVARTPDAPAVITAEGHFSYARIGALADAWASRLQALGAGPESRVAIAMEKGWEQVVAALAVSRAGAAYVPVDPALPPERFAHVLAHAEVAWALTQPRQLAGLSWPEGVTPMAVEAAPPAGVGPPAPAAATPGDMAYVIYTSGSTGQPKGVAVEHGAALNTIVDVNRRFGVGAGDRVLALSSLSFDLSVYDVFGVLAAGGAVVMPAPEAAREPAAWLALMRQAGVTLWNTVPALLEMLVSWAEAGEGALPPGLRLAMLSGDWIPLSLPGRFAALRPGARCVSLGGATEAAIWSILHPIDAVDPGWSSVPYGRPMANQRFYVLDAQLRPRPVGMPGDLYIGGVGLAREYWRDPGRTLASFVVHPTTGERLYRTGDMGRWVIEAGALVIEFLGREDLQVKIGGHRIELGEVESALAAHPGVRSAVVAPEGPARAAKRLAAFVVPADPAHPPAPAALEAFVRAKLPGYMVPASYTLLASLPLSANGKLDRKALGAPTRPPALTPPQALSASAEEAILATLWREALDVEAVAPDDNFFRLGGHSLMAVHVAARLKTEHALELPLRDFFETPTLSALAQRLREAAAPPADVDAVPTEAPLTEAQARLYFLERLRPGTATYHLPLAFRLRGALDVAALDAALGAVEGRHDALRTAFSAAEGQPRAHIVPPRAWRLVASPVAESELEDRLTAEIRRPFALETGPLWRVALWRLGPDDHALVIVLHHLVADGWSLGVLLKELSALYRGQALPPLARPFAQLAALEPMRWSEAAIEAQLDYWRGRLGGPLPVLALPADRPRPAEPSGQGATLRFSAPGPWPEALSAIAREAGGTMFMALLAVYKLWLSGLTGQTDVLVGVPAARRDAETAGMIGLFVDTLVMRTALGGNPSFETLVGRVAETAAGAFAHQDVPLQRLVQALQPGRDATGMPVVRVGFGLQDAPADLGLGTLAATALPLDTGSARSDLTLFMWERDGGWEGAFEYSTELFEPATVERWARDFVALLGACAAAPQRPIAELAAGRSLYARSNLSPGQLLYWMGHQLEPEAPLFTIGASFELPTAIDPAHFERAHVALVADVDALRTVIALEDGVPCQRVLEAGGPALEYVDLSAEADPAAAAAALIECRSRRAFSLAAPPVASLLLRLGPERHIWFLALHHAVCDAWSFPLLWAAMHERYARSRAGTLAEASSLPSFQALVGELRAEAEGAPYRRAAAHWAEKLRAPMPPSRYFGRRAVRSGARVTRVAVRLGEARTAALRALAGAIGRSSDVALFNVFAAALAGLLHRHNGHGRQALGAPFHNRRSARERQAVGQFLSMLPLHLEVAEGDTWRMLAERAEAEFRVAHRHRRFPVANPPSAPHYDVCLSYINQQTPDDVPELRVERLFSGHGRESLFVTVHDFGRTGSLQLDVDFHDDVFAPDERDRLVTQLLAVLDAAVADPDRPIAEAALFTPEEAARVAALLAAPDARPAYVAPRDAIERRLVALWEALFERAPIGVQDDFFALGGHSLLAVQLMARVQAAFGRELPLAALFRGATIEALARALSQAEPAGAASPLVAVQPAGAGAPWFAVHPIGGGVFGYRELAAALSAERPFYGLQASGLEDDVAPLDRVEALAERYVAAVCARQPAGPIRLVGWSFGGLVAFEMARRLRADGRQVEWLGLLDSHLFELAPDDLDEPALRAMFEADMAGVYGAAPALPEGQLSRHFAVFRANARAAAAYRPAPYDGPVHYVQAVDASAEVAAAWARWASGGLTIVRSTGDHHRMMAAPHVAAIAEALRASEVGQT